MQKMQLCTGEESKLKIEIHDEKRKKGHDRGQVKNKVAQSKATKSNDAVLSLGADIPTLTHLDIPLSAYDSQLSGAEPLNRSTSATDDFTDTD